MHSCLSKAITIIAMVVLLASSALHPQSVHAASFTIDNNFINNAKQKAQVEESGYIQGEDCTHWLSWFLETVYGMPTSFGSSWTDTLVHHLINDGDATVITGNGQYDSGGFVPVSQVPSYLASLDSTLLENGGSREYIFAYKWTSNYATSALADHLAAYVGGKQVVSHGINDGSGIYTWSHEYNLVPRAWNGFSGMNQVAIIALSNGSTASPPPAPSAGQNILQNGNFAANAPSTSDPPGWTRLPASGGLMNAATYLNSGLPTASGFGANSPFLETNTSVGGGSVYQDITNYTFNQGAPFLAGVWVRSPTGQPLALSFNLWETGGTPSQGDNVGYTTSGSDWQFIMIQHSIASPNRSALRFQVYLNTPNANYDVGNAFLMAQPSPDVLYGGQYVGQSVPPAQMTPGQQVTASFTVRNTGQLPWYRADSTPPGNNPIYLGGDQPQNRSSAFYTPGQGWQSPGRIAMDQARVDPGQNATFTYVATAPAQIGVYTEHFDVVLDAQNPLLPNRWFGTGLNWTTSVYSVGCGDDRADQFMDAYNRVGGTAELGAPSQCADWYDTNNPGTLMTVQRFDHTADFGPSLISHDQPDDTPRDSIPAFVTRSGVGGAYMNTFGGPGGSLGVPTSDEYNTGTGAAENFAHGALLWNNGNPMAQYWPTTFAGWKAEYWDRPNSFDGQNAFVGPPTYVDDEPAITYDWGTNGPANGHIGVWSAHFSARWTRTLTFAPGSYTFTMVVDDGGRLLIDGAPVIDQWHDANRATYTWTGDLSGSHSMEMDYYQNGDNAVAQLAWVQNIPPTNTPTDTPAPTNVPVSTPVPSATQGDVSIPTNTPLPATAVPPAPTNTTAPVSTATPTPTNTATSTATALPVPSATGTPTPTDTPMSPSPTMTPPPAPTMPAPPPAVPTNTTAPTSAASIPTAPPSSTPGSNPVTAPTPAVAPPSPIRPTSTPARPTALPPMPSPTTYAPEPQTPTPNPTPPLTVRMAGQSVTSGNTLTITIHTSPRAKVTLALSVTTSRTTFTGTGKHRRRVSRTIWLYHLTGGGTADKRGGYIGKLRVSYAPAKSTRASLTVTARTARGVVTRTTWVAIQPRRRYGRR